MNAYNRRIVGIFIKAKGKKCMPEKNIELSKIYQFPKDIAAIKYDNINLIIYTEGCNWLVLSDREYEIFKILQQGKSIEETLNIFEMEQEKVVSVITQIEAKNFEHPIIYDKSEFSLCIYLTNRCNLRCKHCYMYSGEWKIDELPLGVWKNIVEDFKDNHGKIITFTGGELLLFDQWLELIKYCKQLGLKVVLLSNGLLWTENIIREAHQFIDQIQISVDGYDDASYFNVRNYNGFSKALETVKAFAVLGTKVSLAVTPLYEGLEDFIEHFKKFAVEFKQKNPDIPIELSLELIPGRNITISKADNEKYRQQLRDMVNNLYPNYYFENFSMNYTDTNKMANCGFGGITIAPNGDVFWCNRIAELKSDYNAQFTPMHILKRISKQIKEKTSVLHVKPCISCPIKYICGGGCRLKYKNFSEFTSTNQNIIFETECSLEEKENFYRKMIGSNEYFYCE